MRLRKASLPQRIPPGRALDYTGKVIADHGAVDSVRVRSRIVKSEEPPREKRVVAVA